MYRDIIITLETNKDKISYKEFLRYYKYSLKLDEKGFYELLSSIIPYDLNDNDEEMFYEIQGILKYKLINNHYIHM